MTHPYVSKYRDRHGKARYRFRRNGFDAPLPSPESDEFAAEYERLLATAPLTPIRAPHNPVGQFRALMRRHKWAASGEFVYFIARRGMVKIGFSSAVINRLANLTAQSPVPLRLVAAMPGGRGIEKNLHARFASDQIKGEWFRLSPSLKTAIRSIKVGGTFANIV